jgi:hypothetical protein
MRSGAPRTIVEAQLAAPAGALDGVRDDPVEADVVGGPPVGGSLAHGPTGELHDVADERGELVELLDDVPAQTLAILGLQARGVLEDLDVGAQGGDRGAQLVAGVGDQVALGLQRARECVERGVEAGGEPGELVASARW